MDDQDIFRAIVDAQNKGLSAALATVIRAQGSLPRHAGSKMLVWADGRIIGTVGGGAMEAKVIAEAKAVMQSGESKLVSYTLNDLKQGDPGICGGTVELFIEPLLTQPTLVVIGCGHVGKALAELGKWMQYRVIVTDDRAEFCNPDYIPHMDEYIVAPPAQLTQHIKLTPRTYVAAVTRGLPVDVDLFPPLLTADIPYLGLIGSRRRWAITIKALEERGFTREQIAKVHAPIGLELNAETPHEIALSIMAEITMLRHGGTGQPMQWVGTPENAG
ncbi:MAG: XdhC family protein [Anaerolineae bacterium]|nr:XdhC family protein [Anaerolineae bacterium]